MFVLTESTPETAYAGPAIVPRMGMVMVMVAVGGAECWCKASRSGFAERAALLRPSFRGPVSPAKWRHARWPASMQSP